MTIEEIRELINIVNESGVAELEVQRGDNRVRIRRTSRTHHEMTVPAAAPASVRHTDGAACSCRLQLSSQMEGTGSSAVPQTLEEGHELVKSPIVGTYYDAAGPALPFVRVGDQVEPGQVLCIIESMKLMNEIECEIAGTIVAKLVENGRPVEYGEALFAIRPR
jgi:acetyl-CoA carboxylase biotin carboxyl carrier protein